MSWKSGSQLMTDILTDIQEEVDLDGVDDLALRHIYSIMIKNFSNYDCDNLIDAIGIDQQFDKAYDEYYPDEDDECDWDVNDDDDLDE